MIQTNTSDLMFSQAEEFTVDGVAIRILKERKRVGLNQKEFAKLAGVGLATQWRNEAGHRLPKLDYLFALAKHGIDVMFILTGNRSNGALSPNEQILLGYFSKLPPHHQQIAIEIFAVLAGDRSGKAIDERAAA